MHHKVNGNHMDSYVYRHIRMRAEHLMFTHYARSSDLTQVTSFSFNTFITTHTWFMQKPVDMV